MSNRYERVTPGRALRGIPAPAWNGFVDASQWADAQRRSSGRSRAPFVFDSRNTILVKNLAVDDEDAAIDVPRFGVLQITTGPVFDPQDNVDDFTGAVILKGTTPDGHGPFVILLEPAKPNEIVPAVISGTVHCKIDANEADGFENIGWADCKAGAVDRLEASWGGMARILFRSVDTEDDGQAIVQMNQAPFCPTLWFELDEDMVLAGVTDSLPTNGTDATSITYPGKPQSGSDHTTLIYNYDMAIVDGATIADGSTIVAQWIYRGQDPAIDASYFRFLQSFTCPGA